MALTLVVCSLSSTAFADVQKDYVQLKADGYYSFNITDGATLKDGADVGVSIYEADNSKEEIHIYYEKTETGYKSVCVYKGLEDETAEASLVELFWDQITDDTEYIQDNYIIGTTTKINPISGYHFEKITDVSQLSAIATDTTAENLEQILASAYDIANPIVSDEEYNFNDVVFIYGVEEKDVEGQITNTYTLVNMYNPSEKSRMSAGDIESFLADTEYVYMLVKDDQPTEPTTTEAATTEVATTTAAASTAPKTGDSAMMGAFIALGVVALAGIAVVTFASKKEN